MASIGAHTAHRAGIGSPRLNRTGFPNLEHEVGAALELVRGPDARERHEGCEHLTDPNAVIAQSRRPGEPSFCLEQPDRDGSSLGRDGLRSGAEGAGRRQVCGAAQAVAGPDDDGVCRLARRAVGVRACRARRLRFRPGRRRVRPMARIRSSVPDRAGALVSPPRRPRLGNGQRRGGGTVALAGSIRRSADPAVDDYLGEQLLHSAKDRDENAIVTRQIAGALRPYAVWVSAAPEPTVVRVANIQHLAKPMRAQLVSPLGANRAGWDPASERLSAERRAPSRRA